MTTKTPEQHREVLREFAKNPLTRKILLIDVMDAITYLLAVTEPAQIDEAVKFPPLNEGLASILGRPCFAVSGIARRLHDLKLYEVPRKAENEQAAALHWMLTLYFKYGVGWALEGEKILSGAEGAKG